MKSLWDEAKAQTFEGELQRRVYSSRLLGADPSLVLHGGGNTSVKIQERDLFGDVQDLLYVKGSGWDLATIEAKGFAPVRMDSLLRLAELDELTDSEMARQLRLATVEPAAPAPSVEAILHAVLPYRYVDHTHADSIVTITNTPSGERWIRELYGDRVVIIPYVMPGFALAKLCAQLFPEQAHARTVGMVLLNHGLFTFGDTARESYERMISLVSEAEEFLKGKGAWNLPLNRTQRQGEPVGHRISALRTKLSEAAGVPLIVSLREDEALTSFASLPEVGSIATRGPATPDHVLRTKRVPLVGQDVDRYVAAYGEYFQSNSAGAVELKMLDPAPRVVIDPDIGVLAAGRSVGEVEVVGDIYRHTAQIIQRAELLESWQALPEGDIFDVEYWELEQAKLKGGGSRAPFAGEVVVVTGAASGIGRACVESFRARGAAVVGLDINPEVVELSRDASYYGVACDVTDEQALTEAFERAARRFGGVDMLVLNAGVFPPSVRIADLGSDAWSRTIAINATANLSALRIAYPYLRAAPRYGRVVLVGSKNVPAPGPGAAAYSASKAALTQLARITALEWGVDQIRVNVVHPDAVYDTGIWTDEVLRQRAENYGLSVDEYKTKNVLRTEVRSSDVANVIAQLCTLEFAATTGAQVPVDGGNDRVI